MYNIEQYFNIHSIHIQNIGNSSVFQIGTSGVIQAQSHVINPPQFHPYGSDVDVLESQFVVPLPNPT